MHDSNAVSTETVHQYICWELFNSLTLDLAQGDRTTVRAKMLESIMCTRAILLARVESEKKAAAASAAYTPPPTVAKLESIVVSSVTSPTEF